MRIKTVGLAAIVMVAALFAMGVSAQGSLTTTFADNNGSNPNMFDVTPLAGGVIITGFDTHLSTTTAVTYNIYYKSGTYRGFTGNAAAWTLHETVTTTGMGIGTPTSVPLTTPLTVFSQTALFLSTTAASRYTTGSGTAGTPNLFSDSFLEIDCGCAVSASFSTATNDPRIWNGTIYYTPADGAVFSSTDFTGFAKAGAVDAPVASVGLNAYANAQTLNSVAFTYTGNAAPGELTNFTLWDDANGNGSVDGGESQLGSTAAMSSGQVTFTGSPLLSLAGDTDTNLLVTCDIGSGVAGREIISFEITTDTDVSVSPGPDNSGYPIEAGETEIVEYTDSFPYFHDFDADVVAPNMVFNAGAGSYPTAAGVGTAPSSASVTGDSTMTLSQGYGNVSTEEGSHLLVNYYDSPDAVAAFDSRFDLSAFDAASTTSEVRLSFGWYDDGLTSPSGDDFNYVFLSDDGGQTWFVAAYDFNETKDSGSWEKAEVNLSAAFDNAGRSFSSEVVVRIQTGGTATSQATLIDYVEVREVNQGLEVRALPTQSTGDYFLRVQEDMNVFAFSLIPQVNHQAVTSITVTNAGTMQDSDITAVKLWIDVNNNADLDGSDVLLGNETFSGGDATFTGFNLPVNLGTTRDFVVTYSYVAIPAGSVGCEITSASSISNTPDPVFAYSGSFPEGNLLGTVATPTATLPYLEDFESPPSSNVAATTWAGEYPTATATGGGVASANSPNDASIGWWASFNGIDPHNGSGGLGTFEFDRGQATAAMDFLFDLSAYSAASDDLIFRLAWVNNGLSSTSGELDHVFISNDGGQSWITSMLFLDPNSAEDTWHTNFMSVSEVLQNAGVDYTNNMVIRVQFGSDDDYAMVDDVELFAVGPTAPTIGDPVAFGGGAAVGFPEILYYKFNEGSGTTTLNEAVPGEGHQVVDITVNGTPNWVTPGHRGAADLDFDTGLGSQLETGFTGGLAATEDWTIETWFYQVATATYIFGFDGNQCRFYQTGTSMYLYSSGLPTSPTWSQPAMNAWHHVALVNDAAAGTFTVYMDGAQVHTQNANATGTGTMRVGGYYTATGTNWKGQLDEFRVWSQARTLQQIQAGYQSELSSYPNLEFTGSSPNHTATIEQGGNLNFSIAANDINTNDTVKFTVSEAGGSLTAEEAGFDQEFSGGVYNDPNPGQAVPHSLEMTGVADQLGNVELQITAEDASGLTSSVTIDITIIAGDPLVRAVPTELPSMNAYGFGLPSLPEATTVQGYGLTGDLTITAPPQFEVSQTASVGYASTVVLTPIAGDVPRTDIYVRYNPTVAGPHSGTVVASGPGIDIDAEITVDGYILPQIPPTIQRPTSASDESELLTVASETEGTGDGYPVNTFWHDLRMESVYLASELTTAGLSGGTPITQIEYRVAEAPGQNLENVRIRMRHSSDSTVSSLSTSGLTRVYGPVNLSADGFIEDEWYAFKFQTPFIWNGVDNVIVDFTMDGVDFTEGGGIYMRSVGPDRSRTGYDDSVSSYPFNNIANQTGLSEVPAIRMSQGLVVSGTAPDYTAVGVVGDTLSLDFRATDANAQETLEFTITEVGGTLNASQAGFNQAFSGGVYSDPNPGRGPHTLHLDGTALATGTLDLDVDVNDGTDNTIIHVSIEINDPPVLQIEGLPFPTFVAPTSGGPSGEQTFTVAGANLLGPVSITVPDQFEVSTSSGSGFGQSVSLAPSAGALAETTLYVRFNPTGSSPAAGELTIATDRMTSVREVVFGAVGSEPAVSTIDTPVPALFAPAIGTPGEAEAFRVLVANPIGPVMISAPPEFEVSLSGASGYGDSVSVVPPTGQDTHMTIVVFVRYNPLGPAGSATGDILVAASSETTLGVEVQGSVGEAGDEGDSGNSSGDGGGCSTGTTQWGTWTLLFAALASLTLVTRLGRARE